MTLLIMDPSIRAAVAIVAATGEHAALDKLVKIDEERKRKDKEKSSKAEETTQQPDDSPANLEIPSNTHGNATELAASTSVMQDDTIGGLSQPPQPPQPGTPQPSTQPNSEPCLCYNLYTLTNDLSWSVGRYYRRLPHLHGREYAQQC